jgi:hypothetical protein
MLKVYKGCRDGMVATLEIDPKDLNNMGRRRVVDPTHAVYRCQSAKVVGIEHVLTGETAEKAYSGWDETFCYIVGEMIEEPEYDTNIEIVCGKGIHFYLTKEPAVLYALGLMGFKGYTGEVKSWHANGQRWAHGWFKDGKWDGEWDVWHANGQRLSHGWYMDGKLNGEWEWWHDNGKRWKHGWLKDGKKDGEWEWWYENGQRSSTFVSWKVQGWETRWRMGAVV